METKILNLYNFHGDEQDYIFNVVKNTNNFYETFELTKFAKYFSNAKVIADVGANIGNHTLFFSHSSKAQIHSFEPFPVCFEYLQKNVESNNLNVNLYNIALGSEETELSMGVVSDTNSGTARITEDGGTKVRVTTFDSLGIENVDFVKIDVEGFEKDAIMGMKETLLKYKPTLWIEINPENFDTMYEVLHGLDYVIIEKYMYNYICVSKDSELYKDENSTKNLNDSYNVCIERLYDANSKYRDLNIRFSDVKNKLNTTENKLNATEKEYADKLKLLKNSEKELELHVKKLTEFEIKLAEINSKYRVVSENETIYKKRWEESQIQARKYKNSLEAVQNGKLFRIIIKPTYKVSNKLKSIIKKNSAIVDENKAANIYTKRNTENKKYSELNVLLISDEFTSNNLKNEFNIFKPTPENYLNILNNNDIDFFFCESAWQGNSFAWENKISDVGFRDNTKLKELVAECKKRGIPTVFWNKEDPFHFDSFINSAKTFDYVFTTDSGIIEDYKNKGCKNVYWSPFFFDPKIFNPIKEYDVEDKVVFAGAYYPNKFSERGEFMDMMPEVFGNYGLTIYDRNFNNPDIVNQFPEEFKEYIVGTLPPSEIKKAYKGYRVCLNTNSIVESETMFARRVVEVMACNTPMLSSKSNAINNLFKDIIIASNDKNELKNETDLLFNNDEVYENRRLKGVREAFGKYTTEKVIKTILSNSNLSYVEDNKSIDVVAYCRSKEEVQTVVEIFENQLFDERHLHVFIEYYDGYEEEYNNYNNEKMSVYPMEYFKNLEDINQYFKGTAICFIKPSNDYDEYYLTDTMNAFEYLEDNVIVTREVGEAYTFVEDINDKYISIKKININLNEIQELLLNNNIENTKGLKIFNIN